MTFKGTNIKETSKRMKAKKLRHAEKDTKEKTVADSANEEQSTQDHDAAQPESESTAFDFNKSLFDIILYRKHVNEHRNAIREHAKSLSQWTELVDMWKKELQTDQDIVRRVKGMMKSTQRLTDAFRDGLSASTLRSTEATSKASDNDLTSAVIPPKHALSPEGFGDLFAEIVGTKKCDEPTTRSKSDPQPEYDPAEPPIIYELYAGPYYEYLFSLPATDRTRARRKIFRGKCHLPYNVYAAAIYDTWPKPVDDWDPEWHVGSSIYMDRVEAKRQVLLKELRRSVSEIEAIAALVLEDNQGKEVKEPCAPTAEPPTVEPPVADTPITDPPTANHPTANPPNVEPPTMVFETDHETSGTNAEEQHPSPEQLRSIAAMALEAIQAAEQTGQTTFTINPSGASEPATTRVYRLSDFLPRMWFKSGNMD